MNLSNYLSKPEIVAKDVAAALKVPNSLLSQWKTGVRRVPAEHCRAIEKVTNSAVTRYDLRPDVFGPAPACDCTQPQPIKEAA